MPVDTLRVERETRLTRMALRPAMRRGRYDLRGRRTGRVDTPSRKADAQQRDLRREEDDIRAEDSCHPIGRQHSRASMSTCRPTVKAEGGKALRHARFASSRHVRPRHRSISAFTSS